MNNIVPNINLIIKNDTRLGHKIVIPKISGTVQRIASLRKRLIHISGAGIFNSIPHIIREYQEEFRELKSIVDQYLSEVPDCPILEGYISHNWDRKFDMCNSLIDCKENINSCNWTLEPPD